MKLVILDFFLKVRNCGLQDVKESTLKKGSILKALGSRVAPWGFGLGRQNMPKFGSGK
jgi:hypothetical protein